MALKNKVNRENCDISSEYIPIHTGSPLFYNIPSFYHLLSLVRNNKCDFDMHAVLLLLLCIDALEYLIRFERYSTVESKYENTIVSDLPIDTNPYDTNRIISLDDIYTMFISISGSSSSNALGFGMTMPI